MSTIAHPEKVLPGQPILPIYQSTQNEQSIKYIAGENVRLETIHFGNENIPTLVSNALGRVEIRDKSTMVTNNDETEAHTEELAQGSIDKNVKVVNVITRKDPRYKQVSDSHIQDVDCKSYKAVTPQVNDLVLARVTKITHQRANVEIISVLSKDLKIENNLQLLNLLPAESGEFFKGIVRSQDIRSTERDSVKTWECYQPGDIIRATVLSLGDGMSFYLTTAQNDLGVVFARNENGELLYPLDWETMVAPGTGEVEKRKCAKPF